MPEASEPPLIIEVEKLCKYYPDGNVHALREVSFSVRAGESIAIVGPSGCGKSTLLNLIGALDRPTSGTILIHGRSVQGQDLDRLRSQQFGFIFQSFYLLPNLTAIENVQIPMFESGRPVAQRVQEAGRLLGLVGLSDRIHHLPSQLSIGQRQRVAIARALANEPSILFADEPTGSLDSTSGKEIMDLLLDLNHTKQTTLIMVTHDQGLAARMGRAIDMRDGAIVGDRQQVSASTHCH